MKRILSLLLTMSMVLSFVGTTAFAADFDDIDGHWAESAIERWSDYGVVNGVAEGTFAPDANMTRAEMAQLYVNLLNLTEKADISAFTDVPAGAWYAQSVDAMAAKGFLAGRSSTVFAPQDNLSYEEMTTILSAISSWACMEGYAVADEPVPSSQQAAYSGLSTWAQAPAWRLSTLGVELDLSAPQAPATRDQAAHLICQFLQASGLLWNV